MKIPQDNGQELESDEDIIIQGNCVAPNAVCPLTAKNVRFNYLWLTIV